MMPSDTTLIWQTFQFYFILRSLSLSPTIKLSAAAVTRLSRAFVQLFKCEYLVNGKSQHRNVWKTFVDFYVCLRMVPLRKLYSVTFDLRFEYKK